MISTVIMRSGLTKLEPEELLWHAVQDDLGSNPPALCGTRPTGDGWMEMGLVITCPLCAAIVERTEEAKKAVPPPRMPWKR